MAGVISNTKKQEIVVCDLCKGFGIVHTDIKNPFTGSRLVELAESTIDCPQCKGAGVMMKTIVTTYEPFFKKGE